MNFIKKITMLSLALILFSVNSKCMEDSGQRQVRPHTPKPRQERSHAYIDSAEKYAGTILSIGDYLAQLGSIYSIDSTDSSIISIMAKVRTFFNVGYILKSVHRLLDLNKQILKADVVAVASTYIRGKNILVDSNNWKTAASLASNNARRKEDKSLAKKKLCQYAWLTLNKFLANVNVKKMLGVGIVLHPFILELSELYRQHLMYELITNKKK